MTSPRCPKVCRTPPPRPFPKYCGFFSVDSPPPASPLPCPAPSPICSISCSPSRCCKSTTTTKISGQGQLGAKTGIFGARYLLGTTSMGVLRRLPLRDLENSLPKCGGWGSPPSEGSGQKNPAVQSRARFCQEKGPETGMQRAVSAHGCLWAWPQKNNHFGLIGGERRRWEKGERGSRYGASWSLIGKGKTEAQKRLLISRLCVW